ncbi:MAG: helix-turn-helix domain-containing protein [Bacteroidales bacterium]|nr:helix-turn-helix domain-containing protein [Bacteroidales bacterium]
MTKGIYIGLALFLSLASARAQEMAWERLPDLTVPRAGHALLQLDGELTVIGGHTTGFIPTPTAEYFKDGKWNTLSSLYTHDNGFCLRLKDGTILLGGGLQEAFGIGQSFSAERYLPASHSFEPVSILDRRRAASSALEMEDGSILVSGNWFAEDALEMYSAKDGFATVKETAENRSYPWILPTAPDNAIVFSAMDSWGRPGKGWVDRLHGEAFQEPLLLTARPMFSDGDMVQPLCKIGEYDYLMLAVNDSLEANGILRVQGEAFSLLELETEIPLRGAGGPIFYWNPLLCDGEYAWALGTDAENRAYALQIGYKPALEGGKATLKLHYTEPLEDLPQYGAFTLLTDGRIVLAGGIKDSNYKPFASVYIFDPRQETPVADTGSRARSAGMAAGILTGLALVSLGWWLVRRRKKARTERPEPDQAELPEPQSQRERELFERVSAMMEKGLYRRKGLTIAELATTLGTNTKYISSCINTGAGCSFLDYVNGYRVRFAQKKLQETPQMRLSDIADAAGFASESAFYRNFKAVTGQTPAEWLAARN